MSAAIAAACGAAAEVPKKCPGTGGMNPTPEVIMPSAAVMSGFCLTSPPLDEKLPGVIGELSALKNSRRGPSELKGSVTLAELNTPGNGPAGQPTPKKSAVLGMAGVAATA